MKMVQVELLEVSLVSNLLALLKEDMVEVEAKTVEEAKRERKCWKTSTLPARLPTSSIS